MSGSQANCLWCCASEVMWGVIGLQRIYLQESENRDKCIAIKLHWKDVKRTASCHPQDMTPIAKKLQLKKIYWRLPLGKRKLESRKKRLLSIQTLKLHCFLDCAVTLPLCLFSIINFISKMQQTFLYNNSLSGCHGGCLCVSCSCPWNSILITMYKLRFGSVWLFFFSSLSNICLLYDTF